jgi:hypothetical protein
MWLIQLWKAEKRDSRIVKDFLIKRNEYKINKKSILGQSRFARALLQVGPVFGLIRERCREALNKLERDFFKHHKTLSSSSLNPRLDKKIHILSIFAATPH